MAPDTKPQVSRVREWGEQEKSVTRHHPMLLPGRRAAKGDKTIQNQTWQKALLAKERVPHHYAANLIYPCSSPFPHLGTPHPSF